MNPIHDRDGILYMDEVSLPVLAEQYGTPLYVYSHNALAGQYARFAKAFAEKAMVCYAVKANGNLSVLKTFADLGAGFDIVSGGELTRVERAGGDLSKVVFSGVGKTETELRDALAAGIFSFNVESRPELIRLEKVAAGLGRSAPVCVRVNPDVDPKTHPYISTGLHENKFGVPVSEARELYRFAHASPHLSAKGLACHIGSQLLDLSPLRDAARFMAELALSLQQEGLSVDHIDMGGGLGIPYEESAQAPTPEDYARALADGLGDLPVKLVVELGRSLTGMAGVLLAKVEYIKVGSKKNFCIVDTAMNDLLRPSLYEAWHAITSVKATGGAPQSFDVVGPICETGDFLGKNRAFSGLGEGQVLAIKGAGAYGFAMSSNYNTRPRPAEVMVQGAEHRLIRRRETVNDLLALELAALGQGAP